MSQSDSWKSDYWSRFLECKTSELDVNQYLLALQHREVLSFYETRVNSITKASDEMFKALVSPTTLADEYLRPWAKEIALIKLARDQRFAELRQDHVLRVLYNNTVEVKPLVISSLKLKTGVGKARVVLSDRPVAMPPGYWMLRIARGLFFFSPKTVERVFGKIAKAFKGSQ